MKRAGGWPGDVVYIEVSGPRAQHFFAQAAGAGLRLANICCAGAGYRARARGAELEKLRAVAAAGGWQLCVAARRGPGVRCAFLLRRPGLLVGAALFLCLVRWLPGFVWQIDFGGLDAAAQQQFRAVLEQHGVREGAWLAQQKLQAAQDALDSAMQGLGWVSLNFAGGCLFVEQTVRDIQPVQQDPPAGALYAKAGGQVVSVLLQSGFASVEPGQYVAQGQLLANGQKADRQGDAVEQAAAGQVIARMEKSYTAVQPLAQQARLLTGQSAEQTVWHVLDRTFGGAENTEEKEAGAPEEGALCQTIWEPLRLGRIALPAAVCRTSYWMTDTRTLNYTPETAAAMAKRACRRQLMQEFPGAQLEQESAEIEQTQQGMQCTVRYTFCADIAQPGEVHPLAQDTGG